MYRIPVIDMAGTGARITELRVRAGITVRELQHMLGFSTPQAIYSWQQGRALPTIDNLAAFACICGVSIDEVLVYEAPVSERHTA